jgi:hypothetical protein
MRTGKIEIERNHLDEVLKNLPSLRLLLILTHPTDDKKIFLVAEHDDFEANNSLFFDALPEYNILASKHPDGHHTNYRIEKLIESRLPTNGDVWMLHSNDDQKKHATLIQYVGDGEYILLKRSSNCLTAIGARYNQEQMIQRLSEADGEFVGNCNEVKAFDL